MADMLVILHQYTEILVGKRKNYSDVFSDTRDRSDVAAEFVRLACDVYLDCHSYAAAKATITPKLLERLKLDKIVDMIKVPNSIRKADKWDYCLAKIFTKNFDEEKWINEMYYGKLKEAKKTGKSNVPKGYIGNSEEGRERLAYLVRLILMNDYPAYTAEDVYRFSATDSFMNEVIKGYGLKKYYDKLYENPVELAHMALPEEMQNEDLFIRETSNMENDMGDWM